MLTLLYTLEVDELLPFIALLPIAILFTIAWLAGIDAIVPSPNAIFLLALVTADNAVLPIAVF